MQKVQVITDSDSSITPEIAQKFNIKLVPITINFGNEQFTTNIDIDDSLLFQKIDAINKLPTTDAPTQSAFAAAYNEAFVAGAKEILCICVSSVISNTYQAALLAAREFPGRRIKVIDSRYLSIGQGFLALTASEELAKGKSLDEVGQMVENMIPNLTSYAMLSTLKYVAMSGRVGRFLAGFSSALDIRPLLTMKEGSLQMVERVRTGEAAMERLVELMLAGIKGKHIERVAIYQVNNLGDAKLLEARLRQETHFTGEIAIVPFTPGLSVHAGNGLVGAAIYAK